MENSYSEAMSRLPEKKLIRIITTERQSRDPLAVQAAEAELAARGVDEYHIRRTAEEFKKKVVKGKEMVSEQVPAWLRLSHHILDIMCYIALSYSLVYMVVWLELIDDEFLLELLGYAVYAVSFFGYFVLTEFNLHRTPGMHLTGCYVQKAEGGYADFDTIFARTFYRLILIEGFYFVVTGKMLHDKLSDTKVVRKQFVEDEGIEKAFVPDHLQ